MVIGKDIVLLKEENNESPLYDISYVFCTDEGYRSLERKGFFIGCDILNDSIGKLESNFGNMMTLKLQNDFGI
jgi:hypothetical protein